MDQNVRVNIMFQADTTLAQQNIKALGQSLRTVANTKIGFNSGPIAQAAKDAQQLQVHLQNALNVNTGKLDSFLVQPKNVLLSAITTDVETSALGDLIYAYIMLFIYDISITSFLLFTLFIIS